MTVGIDTSSIQINIHADGVKPRVSIDHHPLVLGASSFPGSARFDLSHTKDTAALLEAFRADGRVRFSIEAGDTLDGWEVGFVQIVRLNSCRIRYAGRTRGEGSLQCDPIAELSHKVALDQVGSAASALPWYTPPDNKFSFKGLVATPSMGDGPHINVPLQLANHTASNLDNFLLDFNRDTDYWAILTAIGPDHARWYLAHFHWRVVHTVAFIWVSGVPLPSEGAVSSFKIVEKFVAGPPNDPDLLPVLTNPTGPIANDIFPKAFDNSIIGNDFKSHRESDQWFFGIGDWFWK